jgi:hypothetical protein
MEARRAHSQQSGPVHPFIIRTEHVLAQYHIFCFRKQDLKLCKPTQKYRLQRDQLSHQCTSPEDSSVHEEERARDDGMATSSRSCHVITFFRQPPVSLVMMAALPFLRLTKCCVQQSRYFISSLPPLFRSFLASSLWGLVKDTAVRQKERLRSGNSTGVLLNRIYFCHDETLCPVSLQFDNSKSLHTGWSLFHDTTPFNIYHRALNSMM